MLELFCSMINIKLLILQITVKIKKKIIIYVWRKSLKIQILKGHNSMKINWISIQFCMPIVYRMLELFHSLISIEFLIFQFFFSYISHVNLGSLNQNLVMGVQFVKN